MDTNEIKELSDALQKELLVYISESQNRIRESQESGDPVKVTKEEAKKTTDKFEEIITAIILLWYLLGYKVIDKKAKRLPEEHKKIAETYAAEIIQTYAVRMSQLIQDAVVYKGAKNTLKLLKKIDKEVVANTKVVPRDIGIKFAGRTVSLENYTKMITSTAEQTAKVNGTINKGIQEQIMIYERVERLDSKTCKVCRAAHGTRWDVSKRGIPPALYHPFCRGYWKPVI